MIDRRISKVFDHEVENELIELSDTEILINFSDALTALYPSLIPICAFAYDAWDDIIIPLYYEMVYQTFSFKYGIKIVPSKVHPYMYTLPSYRGIFHVECIPKITRINILKNFEWVTMDIQCLEGKQVIFKSFGDGENFLTGGITKEQSANVHFNLVEVDIVSTESGETDKDNSPLFIPKEDLDFVFVAEDIEDIK